MPPPADAHRVDTDAKRPGELGRRNRIDFARVVLAIGKKDHDAGLGIGFFQPVDRGGDCVPDGGAVSNGADVNVLELRQEDVVIESERRFRERVTREDHHPEAIVITPLDEIGDDVLADRQTVAGFEVFRKHAPRDIDDEHDVDALGVDLFARGAFLRPGER